MSHTAITDVLPHARRKELEGVSLRDVAEGAVGNRLFGFDEGNNVFHDSAHECGKRVGVFSLSSLPVTVGFDVVDGGFTHPVPKGQDRPSLTTGTDFFDLFPGEFGFVFSRCQSDPGQLVRGAVMFVKP